MPKHFIKNAEKYLKEGKDDLAKAEKDLAVHIAEEVHNAYPEDNRSYNHLLTMRMSDPNPDFESVYKDILGYYKGKELLDSALLRTFARAIANYDDYRGSKLELIAYLNALSLSDDIKPENNTNKEDFIISTTSILMNKFQELADVHDSDSFKEAGFAFAQIGIKLAEKLDKNNDAYKKDIKIFKPEILEDLRLRGYNRNSLRQRIDCGMKELINLLCFDTDTFPAIIPKRAILIFNELLKNV